MVWVFFRVFLGCCWGVVGVFFFGVFWCVLGVFWGFFRVFFWGVSHSSTEYEIISLDIGLRLDGLPALNSRDPICKVLNTIQNHDKTEQPVVDSDKNHEANKSNLEEFSMFWWCWPYSLKRPIFASRNFIVCVREQRNSDQDDNKGRSPTMRHVSRTHRVAHDWLFDRINVDPKIQIKYIWHQKPTRRRTDKGKFHTWWMESSSVFVQQPFQFCRVFWSDVEKNATRFRWRKDHSKIEVDDEFSLAM